MTSTKRPNFESGLCVDFKSRKLICFRDVTRVLFGNLAKNMKSRSCLGLRMHSRNMHIHRPRWAAVRYIYIAACFRLMYPRLLIARSVRRWGERFFYRSLAIVRGVRRYTDGCKHILQSIRIHDGGLASQARPARSKISTSSCPRQSPETQPTFRKPQITIRVRRAFKIF